MATLDIIAGARPNFVKIAPIIREMQKIWVDKRHKFRIVHTGQHYDKSLSGVFFEQLGIPEPFVNLGAGSGSQAEQTSAIMQNYERFSAEHPSDFCLVVGDVNSTMATAVVAKKNSVPLGHVEAGLRSFDFGMPEEINRVITDSISDYFFTTSQIAGDNLSRTGVGNDRIFFVGNTMVDTLFSQEKNFREPDFWKSYQLLKKKYLLMTLHRPSNVDDTFKLKKIVTSISTNCGAYQVIFPVHPGVRGAVEIVCRGLHNIKIVPPLPYLEFGFLSKHALGIVTDSGGLSEEATVFAVPCITVRDSTERPETIDLGSNELVGPNIEALALLLNKLLMGEWKSSAVPELWDGKSGRRIVEVLDKLL